MDRNISAHPHKSNQFASLSARRAWIEIVRIVFALLVNGSLSARRAWIEIVQPVPQGVQITVALRKESVDRNTRSAKQSPGASVALRKESVDRNDKSKKLRMMKCKSLSARRAWIEIKALQVFLTHWPVALRKESVDRNTNFARQVCLTCRRSPQGERG